MKEVLNNLIKTWTPGLQGDITIDHEDILRRLELFANEFNETVKNLIQNKEGASAERSGEGARIISLFPKKR
ncbi:MAG: hypothetical protein HYV41_03530 [Candidatus Magasanikbacteria bacterium]|nr:hypothetical protein [Candidatus Magasanikbacteria bacterium]